MKILVVLSMLALVGCAPVRENTAILISVADGCFFELQCDVAETTGNTVTGTLHLLVSNACDQSREVSLPEQDAQLLLPDSASTFTITRQDPLSITAGTTAIFVLPFTMTRGALQASLQIVVFVDGKAHIVGLNITE